jgi:hypothetical protein
MSKYISEEIVRSLTERGYAKKFSGNFINVNGYRLSELINNSRSTVPLIKSFYLNFKEKKQIPLYAIQGSFIDQQHINFVFRYGTGNTYNSLYSYRRSIADISAKIHNVYIRAIARRITSFSSLHSIISKLLHNINGTVNANYKDSLLNTLYKQPNGIYVKQANSSAHRGTYSDLAWALGYSPSLCGTNSLLAFKAANFEVNFGHLIDITRKKVLVQLTINTEYIEYYMLNRLIECPEETIPEIFSVYIDKDFYEGIDTTYSKELLQVAKKGFLNILDPKIKRVFMEGTAYYSELYSDEVKPDFKANITATISTNATLQEEMFKNAKLKEFLKNSQLELVD